MNDINHGYFQHSLKQGEDIYLVVSPLADGVDAFLERVKELQGKMPKPSGADPDTMRQNAQKMQGGEKSFQVESLKLASGGDHPRWVVMGGNFKKFGVTVWPETLEAAGLGKLDPLKVHQPKGNWTAYYVEKQNDEGKMVLDKVVRLAKA